jgi:hypothetical protein
MVRFPRVGCRERLWIWCAIFWLRVLELVLNMRMLADFKPLPGIVAPQFNPVERRRGTELEFVIMVIAVSCVKLLSAHNSTQHTSRKHKV